MTTTRWASEMYRLTDSSSMPAGLDKDDWSDSDYDLTEDEESESDLSNRMDGFLALQAPLDKPHSSDEIEATMSTPCLKNSTAKIDSNNNVVVETEKEKRRKKPKKKEPEPMLMEPVITPKNIASSFLNIPVELKTLCLVDLCTWAALCTFLIYYTGMLCFNQTQTAVSDVFGEFVYHGDPEAETNSTEFRNYEKGFKMGCYGLVEYSICMSLGSAIIERFDLFDRFPVKYFYASAYAIGKIVIVT